MSKWFDAVQRFQNNGTPYVLITIMASMGSTPRSSGTKMVVTADSNIDTIGGGHLEHKAIEKARELLLLGQSQQVMEHYPLASKLGQCCGGAHHVLFEVMAEHHQVLALFGAGHVAKALAPVLAQLPLQIRWIDEREEMFTDAPLVADNVKPIISEEPCAELEELPSNSWVVVMTHNHQLDYELVSHALKRDDLPYVGMIGSDTKARRFFTRLSNQGYQASQLERLVSPIGEQSIPGKKPIEVAVSIAAQLIQMLNNAETQSAAQVKAGWKQGIDMTQTLNHSLNTASNAVKETQK